MILLFANGVVYTDGKLATGVVDTGGKLATSINNASETGGKFVVDTGIVMSFASVVDTGENFCHRCL